VTSSAVICGVAGTPCLAPPQVVNPKNLAFQFPTSDINPRILQLAAKITF